jgi:gamma-glutamylcyclotransferase (GGCT)/AIG2-like uncharacterized protein YtfP
MATWEELLSLVRAHLAAGGRRPKRGGGQAGLGQARRVQAYPILPSPRLKLDLANPEERLIVYGTLVPGGKYHHHLRDLEATWEECTIRGRLGTYRGYPTFKWNPAGEPHPAWLVTSPGLPAKFRQLDEFEGKHYTRRFIPAEVSTRLVIAYIYEGKVKA